MRVGLLTIGEMSRRHDVSLRTLRYYEDQGLICPIRNGVSRYYQPSDELRLQLVLKGKKLGFCIREIRDLIGVASRNDDAPPPADVIQRIEAERLKAKIDELLLERDEIQATLDELQAAFRRAQ